MSKVLVVEDNAASMKLVALLLRTAGHQVLQAADAESGLVLARSERPELVLMDIQLPGIDGLSATRELKLDAMTRDIKIVALTGMAMKGDEERAMAAGCDGYISKPIGYETFLATVERMLNRA